MEQDIVSTVEVLECGVDQAASVGTSEMSERTDTQVSSLIFSLHGYYKVP